jgi:hypothetical protein
MRSFFSFVIVSFTLSLYIFVLSVGMALAAGCWAVPMISGPPKLCFEI